MFMHCCQCGKKFEGHGVLMTADGDFACCEACAEAYRRARDHFFENIAPDPARCAAWLMGAEDLPEG
jgi:hypothetical protein